MAQNNEAAAKQPEVKKRSFGAAFKEFIRKKIVALKRKPQNIAFLFVLVACIFNLLVLGTYSEAVVDYAPEKEWFGLMVFINTLFSLLSVVAFMYSFPKIKKPAKKKRGKDGKEYYKENKTVITYKCGSTKININLIMIAVFAVMIIVMIVCEAMYYKLVYPFYNDQYVQYIVDHPELTEARKATLEATGALFKKSLNYSIVHIVLLAIAAVITALIPLYTKLIMKINTSKVLDSAVSNMQEIDLASDE